MSYFGGGVGLSGVPFRWQVSEDSGATWSPPRLPLIDGPVGSYWPQPISSAFRDRRGRILLASDGSGAESLLWTSENQGATWRDAGGRTAGRHTVFAERKDGCLLGIGGKNSNIDGYMPQAISCDGGETWKVEKSVFPSLEYNQRPALVRLASGKLLFASDWQDRRGSRPRGIEQKGSFVALSADDGRTWKIRSIPSLPHEGHLLRRPGYRYEANGDGTLGYAVAAQGPNGLIHLLTTMNHPCQHFEFNEAWVLSAPASAVVSRTASLPSTSVENYAGGGVRARWSGRAGEDGRFLLSGPVVFYSESGRRIYEAMYNDGWKVGSETRWDASGTKIWEWVRRPDHSGVWVQFWPNGKTRHRSEWKDFRCSGRATAWGVDGNITGEWLFHDGELIP
jgi:hypothetical protein